MSPAALIGRDAELGVLDDVLDTLGSGDGGMVAVDGEPGIGKTSVLGELQKRAERRGFKVHRGAASEFERDHPYAVIADALDAAVAADAGLLGGLAPEMLEELAELLPSLRARAGAGVAKVTDERFRAHRAFRGLLEELAAEAPLVIVLDDLHWADAATVELILALLRRPPGRPALLVVAFRSGEMPERLAAALADQRVSRLTLRPLDRAEAAALLGDRLEARHHDAAFREAGGNPFYLEQLTRSTSWAGDGGKVIGMLVPPAVAASLSAELGGLGPDARALLQGAAVAGEPFEADLAAVAADLDVTAALTALDDLLERDLVRQADLPRRFRFRHPLVRRAVYDGTPGGWRIGAHGRMAAVLAERGAPAAEQAPHLELCAVRGDTAAADVLLDAGRGAIARAPAAAARWLGAALELLPVAARERRAELLHVRATALRAGGDLEGCRGALADAVALLDDDADTEQRTSLTVSLAACEHWMGLHDDARRRLLRAFAALPSEPSAAAVLLGVELTLDALYHLEQEQAYAHGERALAAARALGDPFNVMLGASVLCLAEACGERTAAARTHLAEALASMALVSDEQLASDVETFYVLAWALTYLDRYDDALASADRGLELARAYGRGHMIVPLMLSKMFALELTGRLREALQTAELAADSARLAGNPQHLFWALWEIGLAHWLLGDVQQAYVFTQESDEVARGRGRNMPASAEPGWMLGVTRIAMGDRERGHEVMLDAVGGQDAPNVTTGERIMAFENMADHALATNDLDSAREAAERAVALSDRLDREMARGWARRVRAQVAVAAGDGEAAVQDARAAVAGTGAVGAHMELALARLTLGRALALTGAREDAVSELRAAEGELDKFGARALRDRARAELRSLGARTETRGPAPQELRGVASLSPREREIAELVCDRRTNPEIAATLFLSEKTIETHLRNAFRKLDVSSRVDVARAIELARRDAA